jgi:multidrug efflux system membrane fusion protein
LANGAEFGGYVSFIAAIANAGTRTYDVEITIEGSEKDFFDGMTAEVKIPLDEVMAQQISPAYFSLSTDGKIGVKIVAANKKAKFVEVEILEDDENGTWILGLPDNVEVITTGHEYVLDGQIIEIGK